MSGLALPMPLPSQPLGSTSSNARPGPSGSKQPGATPSKAKSTNVTMSAMKAAPDMTLPAIKASPTPELVELEEEDEGDDDDDEEGGGKKKRSAGGGGGGAGRGDTAGGSTGAKKKAGGVETKGEYKYINEISQMMFVFGEVQDPLPETVKLVEDVVRGQIIEIVTRARLLTHLRSSRFLSAEDVIFLIRDDRGKVNRLRTYLSWKDVRKRAKEDEEGDVDVEDADKAAAKSRKGMVKLPWELLTPFGDFLKTMPSKQVRPDDDEEEDEDEMQAYQDSMQRLREADEITKQMTKDEYVHYSDCRQASFTYRKARRFRDFVNFSAYLDVRPNDDIVDILGFLSFEMVRSLCVTALEVRSRSEKAAQSSSSLPTHGNSTSSQYGLNKTAAGGNRGQNSHLTNGDKLSAASPALKRRLTITSAASPSDPSPSKRTKTDPTFVASPEAAHTPGTIISNHGDSTTAANGHYPARKSTNTSHAHKPVSLFAPPPSARSPLLPCHVLEAFAQIQRQQAASRAGGMKNWRGGMSKGRVALV